MNRACARLLKESVLALAVACGVCALDANAQVAPPPGKALVVLYRVDKQPGAGKVPVIANADRLGDMANGEFVNAIVNPGKTFIRAGDRILTTLAVQTAPNQTYYVLVEAVPGLTPLRVEMRQMPEANARRALAQSRPMGKAPAAAAPRAPLAAAPAVVAPAARAAAAPTAPPPRPTPAPARAPQASAPPKPAPPPARKAPPPEEEDQWQVALIAKAGSFKLANADQVIAPFTATYDTKAKPAGGLELEFRHPSGFALGGEVLYYKNDFTVNAAALHGDQSVVAAMLNAKYYLEVTDWLHPFVGAGAGYAGASFGGDFTGKTSGAAFQGLAGVDIRFGGVGLYVEYKHLTSTTQDNSGQKIKVGASGVFAGISVAF